MRFPWPNLARWQGRQWAIALSLLLAITLTPLGWIQWRQFRLLDDVSTNQVDSIMWQAYQLERELGRLRQSLTHAGSPEVDGDTLVERYEVFLSRIDLLTNIPRRDLLEASFEYTTTVALINDFVKIADPLFAQSQQLIDNPEQRQLLLNRVDALQLPLAELTREANRAVSRFLDERNQQLQQQGLLVIPERLQRLLARQPQRPR